VVGVDWKVIRPQVHPGYSTSSKIFSTTRRVAVSGTIAAADTLYLYPFFVPSTWTFTGGRARTITGGAGSAIKTAIYANETTSGQMAISLPERLWQLITPGRLPPK
jgi:hypothetical protein